MSFLPGPERRDPVQNDGFWKNRISHEEDLALQNRATPLRTNPINWMTPGQSSRGSTADSHQRRHGGAVRDAGSRLASGRGERLRLDTGRSGMSSSICSEAVRSTVLSLELELEKERREAAEREVARLRAMLADKDVDRPLGIPSSRSSAPQRKRR
eukprot:gnl/TRDRNA2_/TRDRNA2_193734_c0_seq1.p1 gnl/TRDRNA2_/TRDRNA2_193734_c0~~gnl/TRDRNA2_/TRDRNA2_193734_c0_seq1.p1  ORF type:complete len:156 (+),score=15.09 gnl/TRDRNA2_/TRDRNA2_193734_c0_seq1:89-556(+)